MSRVGLYLMAETNVNRILRRRDQMAVRKKFWNIHYQGLAEISAARKAFFTETLTPGDFLQEEIFDNPPQFAAFLSASMFLSMLWPDGARTFRLKPIEVLGQEPDEPRREPSAQAILGEQCQKASELFTLFLALYLDAYHRLSDRERFVLQMVEVRGLRYAELAETVGIRPEALKMVVFRARRRIAKRIEQQLAFATA